MPDSTQQATPSLPLYEPAEVSRPAFMTGTDSRFAHDPNAAPTNPGPAAAGAREAILRQLYEVRSKLLAHQRDGSATAQDLDYLAETTREIDMWELQEDNESSSNAWSALDDIASMLAGTLGVPK